MEPQALSAACSSNQDIDLGELSLKRKIETFDLPERIANEDGFPQEKIPKKLVSQECVKDGADEEPEDGSDSSDSSVESIAPFEETNTYSESSEEFVAFSEGPSTSFEGPTTFSEGSEESAVCGEDPTERSEEPTKRSKEPTECSVEPKKRSKEPKKCFKESTNCSKEPTECFNEPTKRSKEPKKRSKEPNKQSKEPTECTASLEKGQIGPGMVVWGKYGTTPIRFLGIVIPPIPIMPINSPKYRNVLWLEERNVSKILVNNICHFTNKEVYRERSEVELSENGISEAVQIIVAQHTLRFDLPKPRTLEQFIAWVEKQKFEDGDHTIPAKILKEIEAINNKFIEIDPEDAPAKPTKIMQFRVEFKDRDTSKLCLGCREATLIKKEPHPLVEGFLCGNCHMRVVENQMVLRLNKKHFRYCQICGWLEKYIYCDSCKRVICRTCMMFWVGEEEYRKAAKNAFKWPCIFCLKYNMYPTKLVAKDCNLNTEVCILNTEETTWPLPMEVKLPRQDCEDKPALRVLSLFDGICTGMVALSNLGLKVDKYFASEVNNDAIMVTRSKFGDAVKQIGDVKDITSETIKEYLPIHLLVGSSPCNDLSKVTHARKDLTDFNGSGTLFFEFYRIMKLIDENQGTPRTFFYLYENVSSMDVAHNNTVSRFFESSPICIDVKFLASMSRPRLFWGNIPQMGSLDKEFLLNARDSNESTLQGHPTPNRRRKATASRIRTVTTKRVLISLTKNDGSPQVMMHGEASTLTVTEIEKIFGFPENFTDVMNLTPSARRRLLGKGWCVQVVQALFRPLTELFQMEEPPTE